MKWFIPCIDSICLENLCTTSKLEDIYAAWRLIEPFFTLEIRILFSPQWLHLLHIIIAVQHFNSIFKCSMYTNLCACTLPSKVKFANYKRGTTTVQMPLKKARMQAASFLINFSLHYLGGRSHIPRLLGAGHIPRNHWVPHSEEQTFPPARDIKKM